MSLSHTDRFFALTELLNAHRALYRERPFIGLPVAWEADMPRLSTVLRGLTMAEVAQFENTPLDIPGVREACPTLVTDLEHLTDWPTLSPVINRRPEMPRRVRHRKWAQLSDFVSVLAERMPQEGGTWLDWCAGKGHLAGAVNERLGVPVTCVEKNPALCRSGAAEAEIRGRNLRFECRDVLDPSTVELLDDTSAVTALHACGDLNIALITYASERRVPFLAVAPCCYQRIDGMEHHPVSELAKRNRVPLTRHLLRLPALSDYRPSAKKRDFRQRQHAFRLGLDLLIREATGKDAYFPLGRISPERMRQDFETFAQTVAAEKGVPLPAVVDWRTAERAGWQRFHLASALGLVRSLFGRAIESWLLLDRVRYLEERGYRVDVGTFCEMSLTPRNLMFVAVRG